MNWMTEIDLLVTKNEIAKPEKMKIPWWKRLESIYNCEQSKKTPISEKTQEEIQLQNVEI